jgi:alpha-1,6-mannosyltransferase
LQSSRLRFRINVLGSIVLAVHVLLSLLSYVQAPALWRLPDSPRSRAFFDELGAQAFQVTSDPATWLAASHWFDSVEYVLFSYFIPLAIATVAAMLMIVMLMREGDYADAGIARLLLRWSLAFGLACAVAFPLFTQDFWLSAVWGRMAAAGINPYHTLFTDEFLVGLPLDHFPMAMSYGPLWAVMSALVALLSHGNVWAMALLFKALIAAAWIAALLLTDRMMRRQPIRDRCLAIATLGWIPLGVSQSVAEGHNDIVMIAPALLWLMLLLRGHWSAPIALTCSVLCKYATAPLFVIDLIAALRRERLEIRDYVLRMILPGLIGAFALILFFRSMAFFDGTRMLGEWHFLRPSEAVDGLEDLIGLPLYPLHLPALAIFPVLAVYCAAAAWSHPSAENLTKAVIAAVAAIMLAAVGHLWPWYLVWGIAFAALLPRWWPSRFLAGLAIAMPFMLSTWWIESLEDYRNIATIGLYAGAGLWVFLTRERAAMHRFSSPAKSD